MLNQFYIPETDRLDAELRQYCKMENVLPGDLKCPVVSKMTIRVRLEKMAFHALSRMNKSLESIMKRLVADLEHRGKVQEYLS
jgi:hypothetical protein